MPSQAYLTWAFERLGTHRDHFGVAAEQLTPAAFKATLTSRALSRAPRRYPTGSGFRILASLIGHMAGEVPVRSSEVRREKAIEASAR